MTRTFALVFQERLDGLQGKAASLRLAEIARQRRDEVIARQDVKPTHIDQAVDGIPNAPLESVAPNGTIFFRFNYLDEVLNFALTALIQNSPHGPVKSGNRPEDQKHYSQDFALFVDGQELTDKTAPIAPTSEVIITNLMPYARKIERGSSVQAPDGVFQVVYVLLKKRYGNAVNIRYTFKEFPAQGPRGLFRKRQMRRASLSAAAVRRDDSFPSIIISSRPL